MKGKENYLFWIFKPGQKNRVIGKFGRQTSFVKTYALLFNLYPGITNLPESQSTTRAEAAVFREIKSGDKNWQSFVFFERIDEHSPYF